MLCANGPFEDCQARMFLKQPNRRLMQLLAVENKTILQQLKPSALYMMCQHTLIFYPHRTGMRSEMLYTRAGQLVFECDRLENFLITRDRPVGNKDTSRKCHKMQYKGLVIEKCSF